MVGWCFDCTCHLTYWIAGMSDQACKCRNTLRECTSCTCWQSCCNKVVSLPSLASTRGLLSHFTGSTRTPNAVPDREAT